MFFEFYEYFLIIRSEEGKFQNSRRIQGDSGEEKIQGGGVKFKEISRRIQGCINPELGLFL